MAGHFEDGPWATSQILNKARAPRTHARRAPIRRCLHMEAETWCPIATAQNARAAAAQAARSRLGHRQAPWGVRAHRSRSQSAAVRYAGRTLNGR
jgi:hypothetical protein